MATFNIEINDRAGKDGMHSVFIRVTENRKHKKIKLFFEVQFDQFNKKAKFGKWVRMSNSKHAVLNREIEQKIDELKDDYKALENAGFEAFEEIKKTHEEIQKLLMVKEPEPETKQIITIKTIIDDYLFHLDSSSSVSYYRSVKYSLLRFVKYVGGDTPVEAISLENMKNFKTHLLDLKLANSTINENFDRIKTALKIPLDEGIILKNPFRQHVALKEHRADPVRLNNDQVKTIEKVGGYTGEKKLTAKAQEWVYHAGNLYLFSYYNAGIRIGDILQLRMGSFNNGRLEYEMNKTGNKKSILLGKEALKILFLYYDPKAKKTDYLFPILRNDRPYSKFVTYAEKRQMPRHVQERLFTHYREAGDNINDALKILFTMLNIPGKAHFHTSRHSFADKARKQMKKSNKLSIYDIKNALGHSSILTTERYMAKFDIEALDEAMQGIFDDDVPEVEYVVIPPDQIDSKQ